MNTQNNYDTYSLNSDYYYNEDNGYIFSPEDSFVKIKSNDNILFVKIGCYFLMKKYRL